MTDILDIKGINHLIIGTHVRTLYLQNIIHNRLDGIPDLYLC